MVLLFYLASKLASEDKQSQVRM